ELEEVGTELRRADGCHESGSKGAVVEADGRVHVGGDEREVVDPTPMRCGRFGCGRHGQSQFCVPFAVGRCRVAECVAGVDRAWSAACWTLAMRWRSSRCSRAESAP